MTYTSYPPPQSQSVRHELLIKYRFISNVYIVRCRDPTTGIDCDININDRLGLINTRLMENYCKLVPDIKLICLTIKRWAKYCDLNDSSGRNGPRTFSSYTLVLMVIGYLQVSNVINISLTATPFARVWTKFLPRCGEYYPIFRTDSRLCLLNLVMVFFISEERRKLYFAIRGFGRFIRVHHLLNLNLGKHCLGGSSMLFSVLR